MLLELLPTWVCDAVYWSYFSLHFSAENVILAPGCSAIFRGVIRSLPSHVRADPSTGCCLDGRIVVLRAGVVRMDCGPVGSDR